MSAGLDKSVLLIIHSVEIPRDNNSFECKSMLLDFFTLDRSICLCILFDCSGTCIVQHCNRLYFMFKRGHTGTRTHVSIITGNGRRSNLGVNQMMRCGDNGPIMAKGANFQLLAIRGS